MTAPVKAPFPYAGGKSRVAPTVWERLGDVYSYLEPFAGSAAVLLSRPEWHTGRREVIGDANGFVVNAWRSIRNEPILTAYWARNPSFHADLTARHRWLVRWAREGGLAWLMDHPDHFDPKVAGWWIFGISNWISISDFGRAAFDGTAVWDSITPIGGNAGTTEYRPSDGVSDSIVMVRDAANGRGVAEQRVADGPAEAVRVSDSRPIIQYDVRQVAGTQEGRLNDGPVPSDRRPHIHPDAYGYGTQELRTSDGVSTGIPSIIYDGRGQGTQETRVTDGVVDRMPSALHHNRGQGAQETRIGDGVVDRRPLATVHGNGLGTQETRRTDGVENKIPKTDATPTGRGTQELRVTDGVEDFIPHAKAAAAGQGTQEPKLTDGPVAGPVALPGTSRVLHPVADCLDADGRLVLSRDDRWVPWFRMLAERLVAVYVVNRPWERTIASRSIMGDFYGQTVGIFLDPPYRTAQRSDNLYALDDGNVSDDAWEWAVANGDREEFRIAFCALEGDYELPPGWTVHRWRNSGMGGGKPGQKAVKPGEVVMFSPHCLTGPEKPPPPKKVKFRPEDHMKPLW